MKATEYWLEKIFGIMTRNPNLLSDLSSDSNYALLQAQGFGMPASALVYKTFTIPNGGSLSPGIYMDELLPYQVVMPAAWTAANITIQTSLNDADYNNLYTYDGTEYTITAAASRSIVLKPVDFINIKWMRLRSGTGAVPVAQGGARTLVVLARAFM